MQSVHSIRMKRILVVQLLAGGLLIGCGFDHSEQGGYVHPDPNHNPWVIEDDTEGDGERGLSRNEMPPAPISVKALNDTTLDECLIVSSGSEHPFYTPTACASALVIGQQDAQQGRDVDAATLTKVGSGSFAFDFSKVSATGAVLPETENTWSCVKDNLSGLLWEVKVDDYNSPRHHAHQFHFYNSTLDIGFISWAEYPCYGLGEEAQCNSESYVAWVNQQSLCGSQNWRLPTMMELYNVLMIKQNPDWLERTFFPYGFSQFDVPYLSSGISPFRTIVEGSLVNTIYSISPTATGLSVGKINPIYTTGLLMLVAD